MMQRRPFGRGCTLCYFAALSVGANLRSIETKTLLRKQNHRKSVFSVCEEEIPACRKGQAGVVLLGRLPQRWGEA
jgi:hypothetical protein